MPTAVSWTKTKKREIIKWKNHSEGSTGQSSSYQRWTRPDKIWSWDQGHVMHVQISMSKNLLWNNLNLSCVSYITVFGYYLYKLIYIVFYCSPKRIVRSSFDLLSIYCRLYYMLLPTLMYQRLLYICTQWHTSAISVYYLQKKVHLVFE